MRKSVHSILIGIFLSSIFLGACKTKKGKSQNYSWAFQVQGDPILRSQWTWFSGRASLDYSDESQNFQAQFQIRMKKDSIVWLSISGPLNFQVARLYMTKDSIHIINYLENSYGSVGVDYLKNFTGAALDLRSIQNLFLGNPIFDTMVYSAENTTWNASMPPINNSIILNSESFADTSIVSEKGTLNSLLLDYNGWFPADTISVPETIEATIKEKLNLSKAVIKWKSASNARIYQYPFTIPEGYKKM